MYRGSGLFPPCAQTQGSMRRRRTPQPRAAIAYTLNFTSLPKWLVSSYNVALLVGVLRYLPGRYVSDKWRRNNKTNNNSYCLVSRECGVLGGIVHAWLSPLVTTGEKKNPHKDSLSQRHPAQGSTGGLQAHLSPLSGGTVIIACLTAASIVREEDFFRACVLIHLYRSSLDILHWRQKQSK